MERIEVKPLDPGHVVWAWLSLTVIWFEERYERFAEVPTFGFLPGQMGDAEGDALGTTGSGTGRDILFSSRVLEMRYPEFFITVLHELHEYLQAGGYHIQQGLKSRPGMCLAELAIERQARLDWKALCREFKLQNCRGAISKL